VNKWSKIRRKRRRRSKLRSHQEKSKEVSTEASSASTPIPILPRGHESSLLGLLDEQTEVIKVEKLFKYSPHSIPGQDTLSDEKLFENSQICEH
jgi:hypothetical protein